MPLSESDTRAKLIDPAIHARGWTEDLIRREETSGAIEIVDGRPRKRSRGRVDYLLRVKVNSDTQPVAVALIEAKAEHLPPNHGLEQAKLYAACRRLNVPFVLSSRVCRVSPSCLSRRFACFVVQDFGPRLLRPKQASRSISSV